MKNAALALLGILFFTLLGFLVGHVISFVGVTAGSIFGFALGVLITFDFLKKDW